MAKVRSWHRTAVPASPNISVVGGQPVVPAAVWDLLSLTLNRLWQPSDVVSLLWCSPLH
jgi:hypothetical protein